MKALCLSLLALALPFIAPAAEPWADAKLPTDKGLELWFDATKQSAARQARKLPVINDGSLRNRTRVTSAACSRSPRLRSGITPRASTWTWVPPARRTSPR